MRELNPRQILIGSLIATTLIEAITLVVSFGLEANVAKASDIGWFTAGIRIHHGFFGILALLLALACRRWRPVLVPWLIVLGIGLVASDLVHHFLVLWPLFGDPQFSFYYPEPVEDVPSRRLLSWTALFFVAEWTIRIVMLLTLTIQAHTRTTVSTLSWLTVLFFIPELGLLFYLLIGRSTLPPWRLARITRVNVAMKELRASLAHDPHIVKPAVEPALEPAVELATSLGHHPILAGNSVELLTRYNDSLDRLAADIDAAQDHVHLLYYIFADDVTAGRITAALERAVARGVICRVLVDAFGSKRYLKRLMPRLKAAGVDACEVLPVGLFSPKSARIDLRNHRKIAVIDGKIGYTGSQNLVDAKFKEGLTYEELVARVTGPVVLELQAVFAADWYLETEQAIDPKRYFPDPVLTGTVAAQVLPSDPSYPVQNVQRLIVALLHAARRRVVITTPYFIPDESLIQAMQVAVLRGVKVHLILSQKMDQPLVGMAQRSYYQELLNAGVRIHLARHNFLHAKHVSFDDRLSMICSTNIDIRSFRLNAEVCLLCYDREVTAQLNRVEEIYFSRCTLLDPENWGRQPLIIRLAQNLARLFSPLL